MLFRKE